MTVRRRCSGDRGGVTTELVLITPLIMLLLQFVVFAGRFVDARSDVVSAARDGARAASIQRDAGDASVMAQQTVDDTLTGEGIECTNDAPTVAVSYSGSNGGGGHAPGNFVHVTVTCGVKLNGLGWLDLGTRTSQHEAVEVIDEFRSAG